MSCFLFFQLLLILYNVRVKTKKSDAYSAFSPETCECFCLLFNLTGLDSGLWTGDKISRPPYLQRSGGVLYVLCALYWDHFTSHIKGRTQSLHISHTPFTTLTRLTWLGLAWLAQAAVPDAIKALKDKKAWFKEQPRPTTTTAKPAQVTDWDMTY